MYQWHELLLYMVCLLGVVPGLQSSCHVLCVVFVSAHATSCSGSEQHRNHSLCCMVRCFASGITSEQHTIPNRALQSNMV
jgi:hypothetical protein